MKKIVLFVLIVLPYILFAQEEDSKIENNEIKNSEGFSFKPQFYFYANHHINHGNNFLSDGHDASFVGLGLQLNLLKFQKFKFGLGWEYHNYDVINPGTIGNIDNTFYTSIFGRFQYQWDLSNRWSLEPYVGIGATKIQQKYDDSDSDSFYGMNLYVGFNIIFKLIDHISFFTGFNYNNIRFNVNTNKNWEDYFNKINQTQIQLGIIVSIGKN